MLGVTNPEIKTRLRSHYIGFTLNRYYEGIPEYERKLLYKEDKKGGPVRGLFARMPGIGET